MDENVQCLDPLSFLPNAPVDKLAFGLEYIIPLALLESPDPPMRILTGCRFPFLLLAAVSPDPCPRLVFARRRWWSASPIPIPFFGVIVRLRSIVPLVVCRVESSCSSSEEDPEEEDAEEEEEDGLYMEEVFARLFCSKAFLFAGCWCWGKDEFESDAVLNRWFGAICCDDAGTGELVWDLLAWASLNAATLMRCEEVSDAMLEPRGRAWGLGGRGSSDCGSGIPGLGKEFLCEGIEFEGKGDTVGEG